MKSWLFLLSILLLAGCVRFQPQPLSSSRSAAELETRSLTNATLQAFLGKNLHREFVDWSATSWDFEMLTLAAFYYHPDLAVARAQWNVARAGIQTAGGRPNPTLSIVPGYNTSRTEASPWLPALSFDLPIETAGKRGHRIAAAEKLSESARFNIATVAWQIRSALRLQLLEFLAAEQREKLLERQVSLEEQIVKRLEQEVQAGAIASSDVFASQLALQKLRVDLATTRSQKAEARAQVAAAIGVPGRALADVNLAPELLDTIVPRKDLTSAELRRTALQRRTDILSSLADYAATEATLQTEIAKQYPDVHISPGYQYDQDDDKWSLGITFDLPILNQNQGPIAEAEARRVEAAARFNALQTRVLAEIERATAVFEASRQNVESLKSLADIQARNLTAIQAQAQAGSADQLELLTAQFEFASSQSVELEANLKLKQATVQLEDAVQQPLDKLPNLESAPISKLTQEKP